MLLPYMVQMLSAKGLNADLESIAKPSVHLAQRGFVVHRWIGENICNELD